MFDNLKTFVKKAVALKYDQDTNSAPQVTAKGSGEIAKQIISLAEKNNIPIKKNEDLVELLSKLELNEEIPPNLYKAIAEIFKFVYELSNKQIKPPQES